ncbi:unnamed protein product [Hermetia illucens]|uniref:Uncharacterized protein n=1 Tax=Hermetia illucens TaxID=343691 RepID=A0A7R8UNP7_HERIL|nr:unnamed protein product [Hermetia illucens]
MNIARLLFFSNVIEEDKFLGDLNLIFRINIFIVSPKAYTRNNTSIKDECNILKESQNISTSTHLTVLNCCG